MDDARLSLLLTLLADGPGDPPALAEPLRLKWIHSAEVARLCRLLAEAAGCCPQDVALAERMGWCHDLGRFPQYRKYRTFDDSRSANHAALSLKLIAGLGLDRDLPPARRGLLRAAVGLHNRPQLPGALTGPLRFFAALLRDADRLDIFRIFREYYEAGPSPGSPLELGYPDTGALTPAVVDAVLAGRSPAYEEGATVQDMRLIKLSWGFTFETPGAAALLLKSGFLEATGRVLPDTGPTRAVLDFAASRLRAMP